MVPKRHPQAASLAAGPGSRKFATQWVALARAGGRPCEPPAHAQAAGGSPEPHLRKGPVRPA